MIQPKQPQSFYASLFKSKWVVYAKRPFLTPNHVVEYLGRYTHKIAISNHRITHIDYLNKQVTFNLKDYRKEGVKTSQTLSTQEFVRRFSQHILPKGFTRIRHYGILSSGWKKEKLPKLQQQLQGIQPKYMQVKQEKTRVSVHRKCPSCKLGLLQTLSVFDKRGPPNKYKHLLEKAHKEMKNS